MLSLLKHISHRDNVQQYTHQVSGLEGTGLLMKLEMNKDRDREIMESMNDTQLTSTGILSPLSYDRLALSL